jgi:hypothetical protein
VSADAPAGARAAPRLPAWLHAAVLAAAFAALYAWTDRRWPDVVVDYGRELYVPWRMLEGERLFRDLSWFNGPLSPSWNALVFRLFGVGLSTLVAVDLVLLALVLALVHARLRSFTSATAATLACLVVLCTSGFAQLIFIGNYNFATPYSHEATHGVLLGLAALAAAHRFAVRGRAAWAVASGACVGLAFLTKPEMFFAAATGGIVAIGLAGLRSRRLVAAAAAFALGTLVPLGGSWLLLRGSLGAADAWSATLGAWPQLAATDVSQQRFYLLSMGLDRPLANAASMVRWALWAIAALAPAATLALLAGEGPQWGRSTKGPQRGHSTVPDTPVAGVSPSWRVGAASPLWTFAAAVATGIACVVLYGDGGWLHAPRAWPLFAGVAFVVAARRAATESDAARWIAAAAFAAFALAMTAKMLLNARLYHYGFALGLPATALVAALAWTAWPAWIARRGGNASVARAGVAAALAGFAGIALVQTARMQAGKTVEVGSGRDRFLADARGATVNEALAWLEGCAVPGAEKPTLAVLPEGVTLNYLSRSRNPTPYFNFMPPEIILFEEARILAAFQARPPDLVFLVHKDTSEYGLRWFGRDYARQLGAWLRDGYDEVARFGDPPLRPGSRFGIAALARRGAAATALPCVTRGRRDAAAPASPAR